MKNMNDFWFVFCFVFFFQFFKHLMRFSILSISVATAEKKTVTYDAVTGRLKIEET
jgi:hypothetical protein